MSIAKKLMTVGGKDSLYVDDVFSTYLYTGSGSGRNILNGIDLEGEGGMVWIKNRSSVTNNQIADSENNMGTGNYTFLSSNTNDPVQYTPGSGVQSFLSNGFGVYGGATTVNGAGQDYASWTFRKAENFFDVVKYSGTATSPTDTSQFQDVPHNLGTTPGMIIVKKLNNDGSLQSWVVNHRAFDGSSRHIKLNSTSQTSFSSNYFGNNLGSGDHSSTFRVVCDEAVNAAGDEYIAYLFAHDDSDESMIKCGGYTGNGNNDGPEIDLGFEPQYLLLKDSSSGGDWMIFDNMRGWSPGNNNNRRLYPNLSDPEGGTTDRLLIQANGFKVITSQSPYNENGNTYIYMAIRRPNKPAEEFEPEELFAVDNGDGTIPGFVSGFPVDGAIRRFNVTTSDNHELSSRLTSGNNLFTNSTSAESVSGTTVFDYMNGYRSDAGATNDYAWMFRRAPGFFDVVTYTGTGGTGTHTHNLGVVPELMIVKGRSVGSNWAVYAAPLGNTKVIELDGSGAAFTSSVWGNTTPTDSVATIGGAANLSGSTYIAYLFASVPGISKVGSYTGTGSAHNIECGFTGSARFVLIKRSSGSGGNWYLWDSARGIVAGGHGLDGREPYLFLNSTNAQVTEDDWIDPYVGGFRITAMAGDGINASQSNPQYLFYAIA